MPEPALWSCSARVECGGGALEVVNGIAEAGQPPILDSDADSHDGSDSVLSRNSDAPDGLPLQMLTKAEPSGEAPERAGEAAASGDLSAEANPWAAYRSGHAASVPSVKSRRRRHSPPRLGTWHANQPDFSATPSKGSKDRARLSRDLATKWSTRDILEAASKNVTQFDLVTAVTAVHRIAKSADKREARDDKRLSGVLALLIDRVVDVVTDSSVHIEAKEVTKTLWALAKIGQGNGQVMDLLAEQAVRKVGEFDGHGLSNIVWAFATLRVWNGPLLDAIA